MKMRSNTSLGARGSVMLLLMLLFVGCKSAKQAVVPSEIAGEIMDTGGFFDSVRKQAFQFETLSARTNMDIRMLKQQLSSRVDIKMVRDSAFQLSIQPMLGMELFRMEFNRDSVKILDRLNKQYMLDSYDALKGQSMIEFNFYNLQALFTNRIFVPGDKDFTPQQYNRFELQQENGLAVARILDSLKDLYTFYADGEKKLLTVRIIEPNEQYILNWRYDDFKPAGGQPFPLQMNMQLTDNGAPVFGLGISFSRIQPNIPLNLEFSIPEKYKRVTFAEILKELGVKAK